MKVAIVVLALIGLGLSAPQPRKLFHEHFEDFMATILDEAGHDMEHLLEHYIEYDEFQTAIDYIRTNNFKDLVVEFLENDNIDIHFFLDLLNEMLDTVQKRSRHSTSGKDFASFIEDTIALFPKEKLSALFNQKIAEDEEFASAIENLKSAEWEAVFSALWENEVFKAEVDTLAANGIDIHALLHEIIAIFGQ
ncbi:Single domain major allergen 1 protein [Operophtera brumata]|uniref:Single domain major allergen 1 protein n=1 Tax=Operophtera brumata TaxID=104452 RepID=A0A0L7LQ68_OPEBR|nr:Single domain major allergen 1 protein [Operophtera brumata]